MRHFELKRKQDETTIVAEYQINITTLLMYLKELKVKELSQLKKI
jgi:hypothetical protein